jgi:hypothetical protein
VDESIDLEAVSTSAVVSSLLSKYDGKKLFNKDMEKIQSEYL